MTIYDEYFHYQEKYATKYGKDKTIVLMQIGAFHESYATKTRGFKKLKELSVLLNLTMTKKDKRDEKVDEKNPNMLGFPTIAITRYIQMLMDAGYTVVIIDQVTPAPDPKREITGIYSPGTYIDKPFSQDANNIVCLYVEDEKQMNGSTLVCVGMSAIDLSTGICTVHEGYSVYGDEKFALDEASRFIQCFNPKETLIYRKKSKPNDINMMSKEWLILYLELESKPYHYYTDINKHFFKPTYQNEFINKVYGSDGMMSPLERLDMERMLYATVSFICLLDFAYQHNEKIINNLCKPVIYQNSKHLILGNNAIAQLNILSSSNNDYGNKKINSLFDVVNKTSTAMGNRLLKSTLVNPLVSSDQIRLRYNCIDECIKSDLCEKLEKPLKYIFDLERLVRKLSLLTLHPFEFCGLHSSLEEVIELIKTVKGTKIMKKLMPTPNNIKKLNDFLILCNKMYDFSIMKQYTINDIQTSFLKSGVNKEIDKVQKKITDNMDFMNNVCTVLSGYIKDSSKFKKKDVLEENELKIYLKRNDRDGYYLDLTKIRARSLQDNIKDNGKIKITDSYDLDPKQLNFKVLPKGNTKIFIDDLTKKSGETEVLTQRIRGMIKDEYVKHLGDYHKQFSVVLSEIVKFVSIVDFVKSGAKVATLYNYSKPEVNEGKTGYINCEELRHPIIERINTASEYIPHKIKIGKQEGNDIEGVLLYGLNSAGKSSLMKAIGLSVVLAQSGLFVPAQKFEFSPYDTLFTRISSNDNLFKGLSSFALEMTELRAILKRTGPKTLVIGDEVCRGTEHISGNAIVATTLVFLARTKSSFIFATHLHEIVKLEKIKALTNVKAFHLTVEYDKKTDTLVFDRLLKPGSGPEVYGITVAKYIVRDDEFMEMAMEFMNEMLQMTNSLMNDKTSKYNSNVYMDGCQVCGKPFEVNNNHTSSFDTHHINHQKDCKDGFVVNKPHLPMNNESNLVVLCKPCHYKVHHGGLEINGYIETSDGIKLQYNYNELLIEESTYDNASDDVIPVLPKKVRKFNNEDIALVMKLKDKFTKAKAKAVLKDKHNLTIGTITIKKIWENQY